MSAVRYDLWMARVQLHLAKATEEDLESQTERLSEQLRRFQGENAR